MLNHIYFITSRCYTETTVFLVLDVELSPHLAVVLFCSQKYFSNFSVDGSSTEIEMFLWLLASLGSLDLISSQAWETGDQNSPELPSLY